MRFRPDRLTVLIAAAAVLGAALVLAREATYGVMLAHDSINYVVSARNLLSGEGLTLHNGRFYVVQPPLYPLLLAAASLGILDPYHVAGPLNAAVFGLTALVVGQYLRARLESRLLAAWACLAVALSVPMAELSSWAMSGPVFILLATLALVQADGFLAEGKTRRLVLAAAFTALACQTRYIGVAVAIMVGLLLLFSGKGGAPLRRRAGRVAVFSLVVAAPMGLWLLRNYLLTGTLTGDRLPSRYTLPTLLDEFAGRLWHGGLLYLDPPWVRRLSLAALSLAAIALAAAVSAAVAAAALGCVPARERRPPSDWRPLYVFGGFGLAYLAVLFSIMLWVDVLSVQSRFLVPLYLPFLVAAVCVLDRLLARGRQGTLPGSVGGPPRPGAMRARAGGKGVGRIAASLTLGAIRTRAGGKPRALAAVLALSLCLWTVGQVVANVRAIGRANAHDLSRGYGAQPWAASETLRYVQENPLDGEVRSNAAIVVSLHNHGTGPYKGMSRQLERLLEKARDGVHVVWFEDYWRRRPYDYGVADLRAYPRLEPVAELADGAIFRVRKAGKP